MPVSSQSASWNPARAAEGRVKRGRVRIADPRHDVPVVTGPARKLERRAWRDDVQPALRVEHVREPVQVVLVRATAMVEDEQPLGLGGGGALSDDQLAHGKTLRAQEAAGNGRLGVEKGRVRRLAWIAAGAAMLILVPTAAADLGDEMALAQKHAPIVRTVAQLEECGHGEPFEPLDVDLLFGEQTVALRGPWNTADIVEIGPEATDLVERYEHHLDYPGNALDPGCDYERWQRRLAADESPAVYAHVVTDPGHPGQLALQYWFFWVFNEFNNLHEGDWEMIQLVFDADDAAEALQEDPVSVGYSSHEGAERADWDDDKLELVGSSRPVVYPAAGSHANKFTDALYLGSSAEHGVGCDDTQGPHVELRPVVRTIPSDPAAASAAFPWIRYEGRWGERQEAFFNGPTGPNLKRQWTEPIAWSEDWRDRSYAIPSGGVFGTDATDFFCSAVAKGSRGLVQLLLNPGLTVLVLGGLVALLLFVATRTTWRPVVPLRVARRRTWGQILRSAARMYVKRARLFLGLGLVLIPLGFVISFVQAVVVGGFGMAGVDTTGESAGALVLLVVTLGTTLALLGLGLVQAATACALVELDAEREIGPVQAFRLALGKVRPLLGALGFAVAVVTVLLATTILAPVAVWLAVRWSLLAQVIEVEDRPGLAALRRSSELVRGRWLRVASLAVVGSGLALAAGPLLGALLIVVTDAPFALLNVVAGVVYALAMPFVALVTSYVYFDARVRHELETEVEPADLPAEIQLSH